MRSEQEFIRYVFERYHALQKRRMRRRRLWIVFSSGVVLLLMITVISGTVYLRGRDVPIAAIPFRVQPKIVTITTTTERRNMNASAGSDSVCIEPRLRSVLENPDNEGALFRVLVWIVGIDAEDLTDVVQQKMEQLTQAGLFCETNDMRLGYRQFYALGTREQIESISRMDMGLFCRLDLALPGRPEGYSEVYDDDLAAYLEILEDGERVCVRMTTAWDNGYTQMYRAPEIGLENEHRLFTGEIDALLQTDPEEVQAILNERIDAICRRYGVEIPGVYERKVGIGYKVLSSHPSDPNKPELYIPDKVYATVPLLELTKEQALAMADDPEIRFLQWSDATLSGNSGQ